MHTTLPLHNGLRYVVLSTSPRRLARSAQACEAAAELLIAAGARVDVIDVRSLPTMPAGMEKEPGFAMPAELVRAGLIIGASDVLVIGGSIQKNQVSGWTRNWLELFRVELAGKPVVPIAAAGSIRAHLAAVQWQGDLFSAFGARPVAPVTVTADLDPDEQISRLSDALAAAALLAGVPA